MTVVDLLVNVGFVSHTHMHYKYWIHKSESTERIRFRPEKVVVVPVDRILRAGTKRGASLVAFLL